MEERQWPLSAVLSIAVTETTLWKCASEKRSLKVEFLNKLLLDSLNLQLIEHEPSMN